MKKIISNIFLGTIFILLNCTINAQILGKNTPRLYVGAYGGSSLMGKADLLIPTYLSNTSNLFIYGQGKGAREDDSWDQTDWTGSAGLGFRHIVDDKAMLGVYVLGDYTHLDDGNYFYVLSPGIETVGKAWEFRANGYYPLGDKDWKTAGFADEFGDYSKITYADHNQYDHWYVYHEETGLGADAELGRKIAKIDGVLVKGYLNGYYFDIKDNKDVIGGGARVTIQPANYAKISLAYSYDRYEHNTLMAGLQLSVYDLFNSDRRDAAVDENDLQQYLFMPIERQFGTLGSGKSIPVIKSDKPEDLGNGLEKTNIWFFKSGITACNDVKEDGTFEHPFIDFTPADIAYVKANYHLYTAKNPYPLLYFAPGNYDLAPFSYCFKDLYYGWGMYGRNYTYTQPAMKTQRPVFIGGMDLTAGNNVLDSIAIHNNNGSQDVGLLINNTALNIYLHNIEVGALNSTSGYTTGMKIDNASQVTLDNSQIYGYGAPASGDADAIGINVFDFKSNLIISNANTIVAAAMGETTNENEYVVAEAITSAGEVYLTGNNNIVSATAIGGTATSMDVIARGFDGFWWSCFATISGNNNIITATAIGGTATAGDVMTESYGVYLELAAAEISGNNNSIIAQASGGTATAGYILPVADGVVVGVKTPKSSALFILSGNNNYIRGEANDCTAPVASGAIPYADGIRDELTDYTPPNTGVLISGNNNTIEGIAISNYAIAAGFAGIDGSAITVSGSGNHFSGQATAAANSAINISEAYGLYVNEGEVNFTSTATGTTITVNGDTKQDGIYATTDGILERDGEDIGDNWNLYTSLMSFTRLGSGLDGFKIEYEGIGELGW